MYQALIVVHVIIAVALIGLILIQHGKGADAGAAFGSGSSSTVFGARGSASFLTRMTSFLAASFFVTSLVLGYMTLQLDKADDSAVVVPTPASEIPETPVAPVQDSDIPEVPAAPAQDSDIPVAPEAKTAPAASPAADSDVNKIPE